MPDSINKLSDDDLETVSGGTNPAESKAKFVGTNPADQEKMSKGGKPATGGKAGPIPPILGGKVKP